MAKYKSGKKKKKKSQKEVVMPIRKVGPGKWKIDNVKGHSKTKKEAVARLRAIKASQSSKRKK